MKFQILGPLEVSDGGVAFVIGEPRHRKLLAVLLAHANEVVSAERLIDALWGTKSPASAASMLHVRMSELRNTLRVGRPDRNAGILTRGSGYQLQVGTDELDALRFERLAGDGRQLLAHGDHEAATATLREALELWRGPPLGEIADLPLARPEVTRLESLRLQALEDWLEAELALGHAADVVAELEALVAVYPLRERFWYQLMLAQFRSNRQGEALQTYRTAHRQLVDLLGIAPGSELQQLHKAILRQDPALELLATQARQQPARHLHNNLPVQLTSFIGREFELSDIRALLRANRLVTVTGVGGAGKSRLALETAASCLPDHPDGIWVVELAPVGTPDLIAPAIATALQIREPHDRPLADYIADQLRDSDVLLVLDNCEHLIHGVAEIAQQLLQSCPHMSILATSRERLGITGEVLRPIAGLPVPELDARSIDAAGQTDAVRLLVSRAAVVQPGFRLDSGTAAAIAQICRRLDGLPLAIELAAARVNALGVEQIATRLGDRFRLLTHGSLAALPRHQTLRAIVDWGYGLLTGAEQLLFDRAAVFVHGFTLEAVEAVCGDGMETVAQLLFRLVDKSMIASETAGFGTRRYRMLETIRAYGLNRMAERDETNGLRDAHAAYFLAFAEPAGDAMRGRYQREWVERLEVEHGNLHAALEWSLEQGDALTATRLAGSIYPLWDLHGHYSEGRRYLALVLAADGDIPPAVRARALLGAATLAVIQGDLDQGVADCEQAAVLCQQAGDLAGLAHALQYLGLAAIYADDFEGAITLLERSLRNALTADDRWVEGWSHVFLAAATIGTRDLDRTMRHAGEAETTLGEVGDAEGVAWTLLLHAIAETERAEYTKAAPLLRRALSGFQQLGALWGLSVSVFLAANLAHTRGDHERVAMLLGAAEALRATAGAAFVPLLQGILDAILSEARTSLGEERFDRAWSVGQTWPVRKAVAEALLEIGVTGA